MLYYACYAGLQCKNGIKTLKNVPIQYGIYHRLFSRITKLVGISPFHVLLSVSIYKNSSGFCGDFNGFMYQNIRNKNRKLKFQN